MVCACVRARASYRVLVVEERQHVAQGIQRLVNEVVMVTNVEAEMAQDSWQYNHTRI